MVFVILFFEEIYVDVLNGPRGSHQLTLLTGSGITVKSILFMLIFSSSDGVAARCNAPLCRQARRRKEKGNLLFLFLFPPLLVLFSRRNIAQKKHAINWRFLAVLILVDITGTSSSFRFSAAAAVV
jgi:hypothetical protein